MQHYEELNPNVYVLLCMTQTTAQRGYKYLKVVVGEHLKSMLKSLFDILRYFTTHFMFLGRSNVL